MEDFMIRFSGNNLGFFQALSLLAMSVLSIGYIYLLAFAYRNATTNYQKNQAGRCILLFYTAGGLLFVPIMISDYLSVVILPAIILLHLYVRKSILRNIDAARLFENSISMAKKEMRMFEKAPFGV